MKDFNLYNIVLFLIFAGSVSCAKYYLKDKINKNFHSYIMFLIFLLLFIIGIFFLKEVFPSLYDLMSLRASLTNYIILLSVWGVTFILNLILFRKVDKTSVVKRPFFQIFLVLIILITSVIISHFVN